MAVHSAQSFHFQSFYLPLLPPPWDEADVSDAGTDAAVVGMEISSINSTASDNARDLQEARIQADRQMAEAQLALANAQIQAAIAKLAEMDDEASRQDFAVGSREPRMGSDGRTAGADAAGHGAPRASPAIAPSQGFGSSRGGTSRD